MRSGSRCIAATGYRFAAYVPSRIQTMTIIAPGGAGKAPAMAALAYHRATGRKAALPNQRLGYAENFLYMLDAGAKQNYTPNPKLARAVEVLFILHAEHEMNCSTAAVRRATAAPRTAAPGTACAL